MRGVLVALMVLTASSASSQVGLQFGPLVSARDDFQDARLGLHGGISFNLNDNFSIGALYVQRGRECCLVHSVEVPVVYRRKLDQVSHVLVGAALSYGEFPEVSALLGLGVEMYAADGRTVELEAAFTHGLIGAIYEEDASDGERGRTFRVGLNVRWTQHVRRPRAEYGLPRPGVAAHGAGTRERT